MNRNIIGSGSIGASYFYFNSAIAGIAYENLSRVTILLSSSEL
jgi:hypothetical protein